MSKFIGLLLGLGLLFYGLFGLIQQASSEDEVDFWSEEDEENWDDWI